MSWSIGSIIVAAATYGYNNRTDQWSWRVPLALQWLFPVSPSFLALYLRELTRLDSPLDSRLLRSRISMVAYSPWPQRRGSSLYPTPQ